MEPEFPEPILLVVWLVSSTSSLSRWDLKMAI
jgi:hypothetical protein